MVILYTHITMQMRKSGYNIMTATLAKPQGQEIILFKAQTHQRNIIITYNIGNILHMVLYIIIVITYKSIPS